MPRSRSTPVADHADIGPSSLHRVLACPGSYLLCKDAPDTAGIDAAIGTAAHTLAALALERTIHDLREFLTTDIDGVTVDEDMTGAVQVYVDHIRTEVVTSKGELLVEQRLDIPALETFGTADAVIVGAHDKILRVYDYKHGRGVKVSAIENPQMLAYASGALARYGTVDDYLGVTVTIVQPRIDHIESYTVGIDELQRWEEDAGRIVALARQGTDALTPGEKQCRFCPAKATCPALRKYSLDHLPEIPDAPIHEEDLGLLLPKLALLEQWISAVRDKAQAVMLAGGAVPGYKLVEGRRSRDWADPEAVKELFKKSFRLRDDEMYTRKLLSPPQAEKLFKGSARRWAKVEPLIAWSTGNPTIAPVADRRPAINQQASISDLPTIGD
jgi:Protein of unknown function (DUF2800)